MAIHDVLSGTPLKQSTLSQLEHNDSIELAIAVLSIDHGASVLDDLAIAVLLATDDVTYLLGFTKDGWDVIEEVSSVDELTHDDDSAAEWVLDRGAFDWYVENGGNPDAEITGSITNRPEAPEFMQPDMEAGQ
jgi:hypothetical protein